MVRAAARRFRAEAASTPDGERVGARLRYLIVSHIPVERDSATRLVVNDLWHRDLAEMARQFPQLTLLAPLSTREAPATDFARPLSDISLTFRPMGTRHDAASHGLRAAGRLRAAWRAVGAADVVHVTAAGGRPPVAWTVAPIALLRRRRIVVVVESAPWRATGRRSPKKRARELLGDTATRLLTRIAIASFFTTEEYRNHFGSRDDERHRVHAASWVPEESLLSERDARESWTLKPPGPIRVAFMSRLTPSKGAAVLLEALDQLHGTDAEVLVFGSGPLETELRRTAQAEEDARPTVRIMGSLPYGPSFLAAIRSVDCVLVPQLGDEQPRVILDAASQAVGALASDTPGIREVVEADVTGVLFAASDPASLAACIRSVAGDRARLARLGLSAHTRALGRTHAEMHASRARVIRTLMPSTRPGRHGRG